MHTGVIQVMEKVKFLPDRTEGPIRRAMHTGANAKAAWASPFCFPIAARGSNGVSIDAKSSV